MQRSISRAVTQESNGRFWVIVSALIAPQPMIPSNNTPSLCPAIILLPLIFGDEFDKLLSEKSKSNHFSNLVFWKPYIGSLSLKIILQITQCALSALNVSFTLCKVFTLKREEMELFCLLEMRRDALEMCRVTTNFMFEIIRDISN